jgi:hypothetical protein
LKPVSGLRRLLMTNRERHSAPTESFLKSRMPKAIRFATFCLFAFCSVDFIQFRPYFRVIFAALLIAWACKSFSFSSGLPSRWQFIWPPSPTPYVDPISPKVTHCHPRFGRGSQTVKAARRKSGVPDEPDFGLAGSNFAAPQTVIVSERL